VAFEATQLSLKFGSYLSVQAGSKANAGEAAAVVALVRFFFFLFSACSRSNNTPRLSGTDAA
jgi:hypothetical protein